MRKSKILSWGSLSLAGLLIAPVPIAALEAEKENNEELLEDNLDSNKTKNKLYQKEIDDRDIWDLINNRDIEELFDFRGVNTIDASTIGIPPSGSQIIEGIEISINWTNWNIDNQDGSIMWSAQLNHSDFGNKIISGIVYGFNSEKDDVTEWNLISSDDIEFAYRINPDPFSLPSEIAKPSNDNITIRGFENTEVEWLKWNVNNKDGTIDWAVEIWNTSFGFNDKIIISGVSEGNGIKSEEVKHKKWDSIDSGEVLNAIPIKGNKYSLPSTISMPPDFYANIKGIFDITIKFQTWEPNDETGLIKSSVIISKEGFEDKFVNVEITGFASLANIEDPWSMINKFDVHKAFGFDNVEGHAEDLKKPDDGLITIAGVPNVNYHFLDWEYNNEKGTIYYRVELNKDGLYTKIIPDTIEGFALKDHSDKVDESKILDPVWYQNAIGVMSSITAVLADEELGMNYLIEENAKPADQRFDTLNRLSDVFEPMLYYKDRFDINSKYDSPDVFISDEKGFDSVFKYQKDPYFGINEDERISSNEYRQSYALSGGLESPETHKSGLYGIVNSFESQANRFYAFKTSMLEIFDNTGPEEKISSDAKTWITDIITQENFKVALKLWVENDYNIQYYAGYVNQASYDNLSNLVNNLIVDDYNTVYERDIDESDKLLLNKLREDQGYTTHFKINRIEVLDRTNFINNQSGINEHWTHGMALEMFKTEDVLSDKGNIYDFLSELGLEGWEKDYIENLIKFQTIGRYSVLEGQKRNKMSILIKEDKLIQLYLQSMSGSFFDVNGNHLSGFKSFNYDWNKWADGGFLF